MLTRIIQIIIITATFTLSLPKVNASTLPFLGPDGSLVICRVLELQKARSGWQMLVQVERVLDGDAPQSKISVEFLSGHGGAVREEPTEQWIGKNALIEFGRVGDKFVVPSSNSANPLAPGGLTITFLNPDEVKNTTAAIEALIAALKMEGTKRTDALTAVSNTEQYPKQVRAYAARMVAGKPF